MYNPPKPPPELVRQWLIEYYGVGLFGEVTQDERYLAKCAAEWGYVQCLKEFEAAAADIVPPTDFEPDNEWPRGHKKEARKPL